MPLVNLVIRGNNYSIACEDGQEEHVKQMSERLTERLNTLATSFGHANDNLLLVLTALMMEDEINELKSGLKKVQTAVNLGENASAADTNTQMAHAINAIADYVENIAQTLENA